MDEITFRCSKWINNATAGKFIENDNVIFGKEMLYQHLPKQYPYVYHPLGTISKTVHHENNGMLASKAKNNCSG